MRNYPGYDESQIQQDKINEKYLNAKIEAEKQLYIAHGRKELEKTYVEEKETRLAQRAEERKHQYDKVEINENGQVIITTMNTSVVVHPRCLTNFCKPKMAKYICIQHPTEQAYQLNFIVDGMERNVFFDAKKVGKSSYIEAKLLQEGAILLCEKKRDYVQRLWAELLNLCKQEKYIPMRAGWFLNEKSKLQFCRKGDLTWEKLKALIVEN